jgi:biotin carboxyl carrier protein
VEYRYTYNGNEYSIRLERGPVDTYQAEIEDRVIVFRAIRGADGSTTLILEGGKHIRTYAATAPANRAGDQRMFVTISGGRAEVYELTRVVDGARRVGGGSGGSLEAQMPGQVTQVLVAEGDTVEEGQPLLIMEAMKMEIRVSAPTAGTITRLFVQQGETVERGQQLAEVTPMGS